MTRERACALIGNWRIVKADLWDRDYSTSSNLPT